MEQFRINARKRVRVRENTGVGFTVFCCSLIGIGAFRGVADTRSILSVALVSESYIFS